MALLFEPLDLRSIRCKNRVVVSPMCQYTARDGYASDWHLVHLGSRAVGGAALVYTEATAISPGGRISPADLGIWEDGQVGPLKKITEFIQAQGAIPGIQLAHAGRKASHHVPWKGGAPLAAAEGAWQTWGPSAIPFKEGTPVPKEMSVNDIGQFLDDLEMATRRALKAGFQVLEIHAAHGYLLHEFLSPISNHRTDQYGGSFENRTRLLLETCDAARKHWPAELPLFVRISATEWVQGGWDGDDSVRLAGELAKHGVDLVDCSTGGNISGVTIPLVPGYQVEFAERIKKETPLMSGAVGLITTAWQAENILQEEKADLVLMARELLRNPYFPLQAARELGVGIDWPDQYARAKPKK